MASRDPADALNHPELIEALAAIEHDRWSHWQRHLHDQCEAMHDGSLIIPATLVRRWTAQLKATYEELSEEEKESDREQVNRYLPVIAAAIRGGPLEAD